VAQPVDDVLIYAGLTPRHFEALEGLVPHLEPAFAQTAELFYTGLLLNPDNARFFRGGEAQQERLRRSLQEFLRRGLSEHSHSQLAEDRAQVGAIHAKHGVEPRLLVAAMNLLRRALHRAASEACVERGYDEAWRGRVHEAVDGVLDVDLAWVLDGYVAYVREHQTKAAEARALDQLSLALQSTLPDSLSVLRSSIDAIRKGRTQDQVERHLDRIQREIDAANQLLATMALGQETDGRRYSGDVQDLVQSALEPVPVEPRIRTQLDLEPLPLARLHHRSVRAVLTSLLTNAATAVKRSSGGTITLRAYRLADALVVEVDDDGPGVPPNARDSIFEALFSSDPAAPGLGLAVARRAVERQGGALELVDRDGPGACFRLSLPGAFPAG
jgi:signal transduction histidine kinase